MPGSARVGIVVGGRGVLQSRSKKVGRQVEEILAEYGLSTHVLAYDSALIDKIKQLDIRLLYDVTNGVYGRVNNIGDLLGLHVIGNSHAASEVYNKVTLKEMLKRLGMQTPGYIVLDRYTYNETWRLLAALSGPVVVKPGSADLLSYGVRCFESIERVEEELKVHIENLFRVDEKVIIETFVQGDELCVGYSALERYGFQMLPAMTINKRTTMFDYETKVRQEYEFIPFMLSPSETAYFTEAGRMLAKAFDIRDYFYINAIKSKSGVVNVFDAGTTVGLGQKSYFPAAAGMLGLSVKDLVFRQFDNYFCRQGAGQVPRPVLAEGKCSN